MCRSRWANNPASFIEEAGFTGIVATNSEFEIERYPRLGDVISVTQVFEDISDEKKTSLGTGHFVTWLSTYTDQNGEVLGRQRFRVFRFKARGPAEPAARRARLMATRLAPTVSPDTEFFWNGLRDHKLLIQRCKGCQALRQPPRPMCPTCNSLDWDTVESSGRGTVYSYVMPQHPPMPLMEYPYIVALVELDEGVRLVSNLMRDRTRPMSKSACPSRSSTRRSTRSTGRTSSCTSSGRPASEVRRMDFTFTEEQETITKVARQLFERRATPERLTELEAGDVRYDAALWRELATVDLLGIALPENVGGSGHGFVELALLLAEVGWSVAPVPVYATLLLGADTIARHGDDEQQQRYLPDVVNGDPHSHRGVDRTRPLRPDRARDHRASRRRRLAPGRNQGAGSCGSGRPHHAHPRDGRRRWTSACSCSTRTPTASRFGPRRRPTASRTPTYSSTAQPFPVRTGYPATAPR